MSLLKKEEGLCGLGSCTPKCLQPCANIKVFGIFYAFNFLVTIAVGIYLSSQITSIEKQFNLSSEQSGIISSTNDIGFVLTVLIFSFYGRRTHIPVLLGISSVMFGVSGKCTPRVNLKVMFFFFSTGIITDTGTCIIHQNEVDHLRITSRISS